MSSSDADLSMPMRQVKPDVHGDPVANAQRSFTDPDSQLMKDGNGFSQSYNCQAAVDEAHQVIVAAGLSNQANDSRHLIPMLNSVIKNCGGAPSTFTADAGYSSDENLKHCDEIGTDAYIPSRRKSATDDGSSPSKPPADSPPRRTDEMDAKLSTDEGQAIYRKRTYVGEAPFGNIKAARGFRQLLLRGIEQAQHEWSLICAGHNLLKLFKAKGTGAV